MMAAASVTYRKVFGIVRVADLELVAPIPG
jgi:hypothetical protein